MLRFSLPQKIHHFPVTGSTNDEAIRRAREGGEEGEIFIAERQTAGRGRMGRNWESPEGKNLYLSFLLRPPVTPARAALITLTAGAAAFEAVAPFLPQSLCESLKIKWPNDLILQGKKLSGILTEMDTKGAQIRWVVTGIGLNLNAEPADFSPEVRKTATSVRMATGREVDRESVAARLIESFERRYEAFLRGRSAEIIEFCNRVSYLKGRRIRSGGIFGIAGDLSPEGYLQILTDSGERKVIVAGDLVVEEGG